MVKITSTVVLAALVALAAGQRVDIAAPAPFSTFSQGEQFVVDVKRENNLILSQDVSVAIGLLSCAGLSPTGTCDDVALDQGIGTVLFAGPYSPQSLPGSLGFSQNYTVTIPEFFTPGAAALTVAHFYLLGDRNTNATPHIEIRNETIVIGA